MNHVCHTNGRILVEKEAHALKEGPVSHDSYEYLAQTYFFLKPFAGSSVDAVVPGVQGLINRTYSPKYLLFTHVTR